MTASLPIAVEVLAYLRVSKEEQARQDKTSLGHQRFHLQQLAGKLGAEISEDRWFTDPGVSGGTAEDRPAFQALLAFCREHPQTRRRPGYVLVYNDSRWGRFTDFEEATYWRVELKKHFHWLVRFAENDDSENPMARGLMRSLFSSQATAVREQIRANAKQGARGTAAQGFWQVEAPIGYRRMATAKDGRTRVLELGQRKADDERVKLTPGPAEEVALVRWMFDAYAAPGNTLGSLMRALMTRWPARRWSRRTVQAVLENPAYVGDVVWCRRPHDKEERSETPVRSRDQWVTSADAHPALIARDLFARVAAKMQVNRHQVRQPKSDYILSGLLTCAHCGQPYLGKGGPKGPPGDPERYRFYCDRGSDPRHAHCPGPTGTLQKRYIEPLVIQAIGDLVRQPALQRQIAKAFDQLMGHAGGQHATVSAQIDVECARLSAERDRLVDAVARGVFSESDVVERMAGVRRRLEELHSERDQASFAGRRLDRLDAERERFLQIAADFPGLAARLRGPALKELIQPWIHSGVVDKVQRTVTLTLRLIPAIGLIGGIVGTPGLSSQPTKSFLYKKAVIPLPPVIARRRRAV